MLDEDFEIQVRRGDEVVARVHHTTFPTAEVIMDAMNKFGGSSVTIQKIFTPSTIPFSEPQILSASDIDCSNTVFMTLSNPFYYGDEINTMDVAYEYPRERIHMIEIVKLAVRCGLKLNFHSYNEKAMTWLSDYYEVYKS